MNFQSDIGSIRLNKGIIIKKVSNNERKKIWRMRTLPEFEFFSLKWIMQFQVSLKRGEKFSYQIPGDIFDDLITGVARESKMILDNLGIQVNLNEVYSAYAAEIGVATESLTKQQRQTALLDEANRQLEKSTAAVTDEMVKQSTKGTAAIKKVENAWNLFLNTSAKGFVRLGEIIGQTAAANPFADVQRQYVEWQSYLKKAQTITSDAEVMSFEEYRKWRKARSKLDKEELTLKAKMQEDYLKWEKDARERVYDEGDVAAMLPSERFAAQQDASFKSFWENRSKKRA